MSQLSMRKHVMQVTKECKLYLNDIDDLRHLLTQETAFVLARSLIFYYAWTTA